MYSDCLTKMYPLRKVLLIHLSLVHLQYLKHPVQTFLNLLEYHIFPMQLMLPRHFPIKSRLNDNLPPLQLLRPYLSIATHRTTKFPLYNRVSFNNNTLQLVLLQYSPIISRHKSGLRLQSPSSSTTLAISPSLIVGFPALSSCQWLVEPPGNVDSPAASCGPVCRPGPPAHPGNQRHLQYLEFNFEDKMPELNTKTPMSGVNVMD